MRSLLSGMVSKGLVVKASPQIKIQENAAQS